MFFHSRFTVCTAVTALVLLMAAGGVPAQGQQGAGEAATPTGIPSEPMKMPARGGSVTIKVENYEEARQRILNIALAEGAQLIDGKTNVTEKGRRHGWIRLRLASDRLTRLLPAIRATGKLYAENVTTYDRASEYEELERRVNRLREHQTRLDSLLLRSSRRLRGSDILYVQERLFRASVDEDLLRQKRMDLERDTRACRITIQLFEPIPVRALDRARIDIAARFAGAKNMAGLSMNGLFARAATAGAYALVFAPFWVPCLVAALLLLRWLWVRREWLVGQAMFLCRQAIFLYQAARRLIAQAREVQIALPAGAAVTTGASGGGGAPPASPDTVA